MIWLCDLDEEKINKPIIKKQKASKKLPLIKTIIPAKKARKEINLAEAIATFIPALLLPVKYHIKDFNITPPSRGIIGSKLNIPIKKLRPPTCLNKLEIIKLDPDKILLNKNIKKASRRLTLGPEIAIFKLPFDVAHSFSRFAIPPRKKSVMSLTFRPSPIATKE